MNEHEKMRHVFLKAQELHEWARVHCSNAFVVYLLSMVVHEAQLQYEMGRRLAELRNSEK